MTGHHGPRAPPSHLTRQPWNGTRMDECTMLPTKSFSVLFAEKLRWPLRQGRRHSATSLRHLVGGLLSGFAHLEQQEYADAAPTAGWQSAPGAQAESQAPESKRTGAHQSWPITKRAQNMVPCASQ